MGMNPPTPPHGLDSGSSDPIDRAGAWPAERMAVGCVWLLFVAWALVFIRLSSFVTPDGVGRYCLFDDAMVSMRYAWSLVQGHGLVWNPGERIEGITNLLMTLFMAGWLTLLPKEQAVLAVQLSGLAFVVITGWASARVAVAIAGPTGARWPGFRPLVLAACLSFYPLAYWSLMGMETGLLAALVSLSVLIVIRRDGNPRPSLALGVLLGLAFMTRPDAAVLVAVIFLYRLSGARRHPDTLRASSIEAAVVSVFVVGVSLFRLAYYGSLTPNTYLLKVGGFPLADRLENGLGFVAPFVASVALPLVGTLGLALLDGSRAKLLIVGLVATAISYQVWVGGDSFPYWRQMAPVMPLFCGLVAVEVVHLLERRVRRTPGETILALHPRPWAVIRAGVAFALTGLAAWGMNAGSTRQMLFRDPPYQVGDNRENVTVAMALQDVLLPGASVGVSWAGAIPYYTEAPAVDFLGKSDRRIAGLAPDLSGKIGGFGMRSVPGHNKYDLEYSIRERRPTYIQEYRWGRQNLRDWVDEHYVGVWHRGAALCLEENSPLIDWRRILTERHRGCVEGWGPALRARRGRFGRAQ